MSSSSSTMSSSKMNILITGANSGLGLGICLRLIDDFLANQSSTSSMNLIFTTRTSRKSRDTLRTLEDHLRNRHPPQNRNRVTFQPESVDLTNLLSVVDLARTLNGSSLTHLDTIMCNAGIGGWSGVDWFQAVYSMLKDFSTATTWPTFKLGIVGAVTRSQFPSDTVTKSEPPLGEVFCANLFGHYMLVHYLMPLLRAAGPESPAKVIWVSSNEPQSHHFDERDFQGLRTDAAYEHSKRMTDLLALTADGPMSQQEFESFIAISDSNTMANPDGSIKRSVRSRPTFQVCHPGTVVTSVMSLAWILQPGYLAAIYLARWLGSVWATVSAYEAAHAASMLTFADQARIRDAEARAACVPGKIKWGTSINRWGQTKVQPTELPGWGVNGTGQPYVEQWWGGPSGRGRKPGSKEATQVDVDDFVALGGRLWAGMEKLRVEWEERIMEAERGGAKSIQH